MSWLRRLGQRIRHPTRGTRRDSRDGEAMRLVSVNGAEQSERFVSNRIKNSKYTILTFLPKNFGEQFRYVAVSWSERRAIAHDSWRFAAAL